MRIDQLVVGAASGDAITEAALRLQWALRKIGPSEIYAMHPDSSVEGRIEWVEKFPQHCAPDDVLIFHVSIGESNVLDFVLRRPERLILAYHNITPASFFQQLDPHFASLLRTGRWQLKSLAARAVGAIAHSSYNAEELRELGMTAVEVAPPSLNLGRLHDVEPDLEVTAELAREPGPVVLVVGQMLPHKRPELAVQAHHLLNVNHFPESRLFLVGPTRRHDFTSPLARHIWSLNLPTVNITGPVSDAALAAYYRRADVMVVPSEHEGFCVPIIEAFSFGVPVVTRAFAAIPETAGDAGLVLPSTAGAADLCEATARVLNDRPLAAELSARGLRRAEDFTALGTLEASLTALAKILAGADPARA